MSDKKLSMLFIREDNGQSTHLRFSYEMLWTIGILLGVILGGVCFVLYGLVDTSSTADLMDENLYLRSQVQDLELDVIELERQIELLQMYALEAKIPNSGAWLLDDLDAPNQGLPITDKLLQRMIVLQQKVQLLYPVVLEQAENVNAQKNQFSRIPKDWPVKGVLTSGFKYRVNPLTGKRKFHNGLDIGAPYNTKITAPMDGTVIYAGWMGGYGNCIDIDHGQGVITRYGHNAKLLVKVGQQVKKGEKIAEIGSTGHSTGPHLHYEIRVDGVAINPLKYITSQ